MIKIKTAAEIYDSERKAVEFSPLVDDYMLNEETNELEVLPTKKDIQAYIQSFEKCALDNILDAFLPGETAESDDVRDYTKTRFDLADVGEAFEKAEDYRERLGLGDDLSVAEVFKKMQEYANTLKSKIDESNKSEVKDDEIQKTDE